MFSVAGAEPPAVSRSVAGARMVEGGICAGRRRHRNVVYGNGLAYLARLCAAASAEQPHHRLRAAALDGVDALARWRDLARNQVFVGGTETREQRVRKEKRT